MGTAICERSIEIRLGEGSTLEMLFVNREKGQFLSVFLDDIQNWLERSKILTQRGRY